MSTASPVRCLEFIVLEYPLRTNSLCSASVLVVLVISIGIPALLAFLIKSLTLVLNGSISLFVSLLDMNLL